MHQEDMKDDLMERLSEKPDMNDIINEVMENTEMISMLLNIIRTDKGSVKFYCEKIIRMISEKKPVLIYPYFDEMASLLNSPNHFIQWGSIKTLANLISVDIENKFTSIYEEFFGLINTDSMITAGTVIENAWKIVLEKPEYENDIMLRP